MSTGGVSSVEKSYIAIDLKSFYASVECVERSLDPLTANLVVADERRTEKTICLAVSPSLKAYGISGRARLFEVNQRIKEINNSRLRALKGQSFKGESFEAPKLKNDPSLEVSFIAAPPRMALYMQYSRDICDIYLKYIAPEDIHIYSVDEVFIDVSAYLRTYDMTPRQLTEKLVNEVYETTGITATAGIGTNLYLCKVAMDISAKHMSPDRNGMRIAELNEDSYRRTLWGHRPITDFWRVGSGYAKRLAKCGLYTMGDVAKCSVGDENDYYNEELLYRLFGINAELLIDHAWGYEPCTLDIIKQYRPENNSLSSGQVLQTPYSFDKARLIVSEMADILSLDLVDKALVTDQIILTVGYDKDSLTDPDIRRQYKGEIKEDRYGRAVPKHAHGSFNLDAPTASTRLITKAALEIYDRTVDPRLLIRRLSIAANHVVSETSVEEREEYEQLDLFTDHEEKERQRQREEEELKKESSIQHALIDLKKKYGKNAVLRGTNFLEGATMRERNNQIGGHRA